jgi:uncharacterized phage protein (TIGR01671 family)
MEYKGGGQAMRQFRGQTKEGQWVKGWYATHKAFPELHFILEQKEKDAQYFKNYLHGWDFIDLFKVHEVLPETVAQSTGKKDKNGKEIFANDKVKGRSYIQTDGRYTPFEGVVEWSEQYAGYYIKGNDNNGRNYMEIIGTIHDPDLLK